MYEPTPEMLAAGLASILEAPGHAGPLRLIVRRPTVDAREVLQEGFLEPGIGLAGDSYLARSSSRTADGSPHPDMQINIMSARVAALVAGPVNRWPLAGDQLFVDLDLRPDNLPPGTRLSLGEAELVVTDQPHTGCAKFSARFGSAALRFVNSPEGRRMNLRGINARVERAGRIRVGDLIVPRSD